MRTRTWASLALLMGLGQAAMAQEGGGEPPVTTEAQRQGAQKTDRKSVV